MGHLLYVSKTQRNLPHWTSEHPCTIYWLTFRLADSIPQDKLTAWRTEFEAWAKRHPQPWDERTWEEYNERFGDRFEKWLDAGMGSCALARPDVRERVRECLTFFDGMRLRIHAAVIMPTHAHCLLEPLEKGFELSGWLRGIKSRSAQQVNKLLGRKGKFWQDESYDHLVRSEAQYAHYMRYTQENPVRAGLKEGTYWRM